MAEVIVRLPADGNSYTQHAADGLAAAGVLYVSVDGRTRELHAVHRAEVTDGGRALLLTVDPAPTDRPRVLVCRYCGARVVPDPDFGGWIADWRDPDDDDDPALCAASPTHDHMPLTDIRALMTPGR